MKKNSFKIGKVAEWSLQKWRNQVALNDTIKGIKNRVENENVISVWLPLVGLWELYACDNVTKYI